MLFTHDGIGGPAVLDFSRLLADDLANTSEPVEMAIDMFPEKQVPTLKNKLSIFAPTSEKRTGRRTSAVSAASTCSGDMQNA